MEPHRTSNATEPFKSGSNTVETCSTISWNAMQFFGENVHPLEERFPLPARLDGVVRYPLLACLQSLEKRK